MKRILQNSFFKCIGPENQSGITFVEVVVVGVLVPLVVRNVKNYVINVERNTENQDSYLA
jgi:Tfp pilus assembly protein PilE